MPSLFNILGCLGSEVLHISTDFSSLLDLFLGILNAYGGKCNFYWVVIFLNFGSGFLLFFDF